MLKLLEMKALTIINGFALFGKFSIMRDSFERVEARLKSCTQLLKQVVSNIKLLLVRR